MKTYTLRVHEGNISQYGFLIFLNFGDYDEFLVQYIDKYSEKAEAVIKLMLKLGMKEIEQKKIPVTTLAGYTIAIRQVTIKKLGIHK